jgi:hypothetical protein
MTTTDLNLNTAGEQRSFDVIPANTVVTLQLKIRPGGGEDDGWLTTARDGLSHGLDCEFTVTDGEHARRKLFQRLTLRGTTDGHAEAGQVSRNTLRAIVESARGILPKDNSDAAQEKRKLAGWQELDGIRFIAKLGVRPARDGYAAQNTILDIITPDRTAWKQVDQVATQAPAPASNTQPPANSVTRPQWAE